MTDISTNYGRLRLKSPVIAGSSGLTDNIEQLLEFEKYGAGAVVLKSLFEEEIVREMSANLSAMNSTSFVYPETLEFYEYFDGPKESTTSYLNLIKEAKANLSIPVIASINCIDAQNWTYFPKQIERAGADGIELNIFIFPGDLITSAEANEQTYLEIISEVQKQVQLPIYVKLSYYASNLSAFLQKLSATGIDGLVLFNRFYNPDIDIEKLEINSGAILSSPGDIHQSLRWIAIMAERSQCDLIASTGIHSHEGVIKQLLAGATAVQMTSAFYKNGIAQLEEVLSSLRKWMDSKNYSQIADFKGSLSQAKAEDPAVYSRIQFMKYYRGFPK